MYVAEGVQLYRRVSLFFEDTNRRDRVLPHGIVMALGLLHIIIGTALKIKQKEDQNIAHFESTHAIVGKYYSYHSSLNIDSLSNLLTVFQNDSDES